MRLQYKHGGKWRSVKSANKVLTNGSGVRKDKYRVDARGTFRFRAKTLPGDSLMSHLVEGSGEWRTPWVNAGCSTSADGCSSLAKHRSTTRQSAEARHYGVTTRLLAETMRLASNSRRSQVRIR